MIREGIIQGHGVTTHRIQVEAVVEEAPEVVAYELQSDRAGCVGARGKCDQL
jgi:hypothetical protein